jgi:hypothetical protein
MTNTSSRFRNGPHSLNRGLDRRLDRGLARYATTMLDGAHRPRRPNELVLVCRLLTQYLREARRMARDEPHIFGPHARRYFLETLELEKYEQEVHAALDKVYGPPPPGTPPRVSTLWTDRYSPRPEQRRLFLKWFKERYPSK